MTIWAFDAVATAAWSPTSGGSPGCCTPTTTACGTSRRGRPPRCRSTTCRQGPRWRCAGFGLTFCDVMRAVTPGRGGRFVPTPAGLRYLPSGDEPRLVEPLIRLEADLACSTGAAHPLTSLARPSRDRWFTTPGDYHAGLARLLRADARRAGARLWTAPSRRPPRCRWFTEVGTGRSGQDSPFFRDADTIAAALLARP
ncbi:hypothetical protein [Nonomuraea rubra]|uniref:hypothetical protein n=1 Tax=Nonomuraea rubra TaxID=46180 RepID=UPI0033ECA532